MPQEQLTVNINMRWHYPFLVELGIRLAFLPLIQPLWLSNLFFKIARLEINYGKDWEEATVSMYREIVNTGKAEGFTE